MDVYYDELNTKERLAIRSKRKLEEIANVILFTFLKFHETVRKQEMKYYLIV